MAGMRFLLHIPAYHTAEGRDVDPRRMHVRLDHLPRENEQIEVPNGGIVEVVNIRYRPIWSQDEGPELVVTYGEDYAVGEVEPEVFTGWVRRPNDAPKTRSVPHKLGRPR